MRRRLIAIFGIILVVLLSFIYVAASGISSLSNENILFLFLDETKGDPGTVEVASLAQFENAHLKHGLVKINPLESTDLLKREGISILDSLIKAQSLKEGLENAKMIAEQETQTTIDRVVLIDSEAFSLLVDAVHPIPIDKSFHVDVLDKTFDLSTRTLVTGEASKLCIRGKEYPGIPSDELLGIPEDYLWEVKAEIINAVADTLLDFNEYTREEKDQFSSVLVSQYKEGLISVHERTTILSLVYYLPEFLSKPLVSFAIRQID